MKSADNSKGIMEDNDEEEEFEHFDDFTLASSWERFISEIEAVCRQWLADGPKNLLAKGAVQVNQLKDLYKIKSEFKYATKSYCMEYYFATVDDGKTLDWDHALHDLQLSFGVKEFVVIAPQSASGVVLDAPEASKLLSAVAIALSNCSCLWPAFVPVHDSSRKAYIGIQNMGTVFTRRFEADRIASQVPVKLMHLEGLYELFVSKFAYTAVDWSMNHFEVHFKMKLTYRTPIHDDEDEIHDPDADITGSSENPEVDNHVKAQWDDNFPWSKWYSAEDPVNGFELLAIWLEITAESSLDMAELENASPVEADKWFLSPCLSEYLDISGGSTIGFASQLHLLVKALEMSSEAKFIEDFISGSEALKSSAVVPPQTVLDRVLKDLFHEAVETEMISSPTEHKNSRSIKGAPQESLFEQFCLHALWFGNCSIRAISVLWIEFVREVRWCWEESQSLPRMPSSGPIELSTCLINQKLHMLAVCIDQKHRVAEGQFVDANDTMTTQEDLQNPTHNSSSQGASKEGSDRKDNSNDAANVAKPMMLLKSNKIMHVPITLEPPPMTEDMHEERLKAAVALGDSYSFSAQLETEILASDMSAFKAANPDAVFEDFIRWHSPRDWENDENEENGASESSSWPPRGKLSERMSDPGNSWRKIWNEAPAVPASEQKPLWDPNREGEKVLHYLETLRPYQLLEEMVCAAFRAAADTLNRTSFGDLKQMNIKIEQLYITIASVLRIFLVQNTATDTEVLEDLRRLSTTFEHIEKLVLLAASLHVKFLQSPYLGQAIFTDCFNFYLPNMGTSSANAHNDTQREFDKKQQIRSDDRDLILSMFPPPTANQSWRRVLSMGNLLNGHEPILREIIFSKRDHASGSYYAASSPRLHQQDIETYRMYVSGTSNDLGVALAVASYD
ncbi:rab3 GTPase-activating protein catalytic subunit-like isoform X2 [Salvia splendens]|uniref:rab3 GTPase-activating protein catalytic subunit-like isoform X2 n=1 Tax=Salvia splendens TaxID=180675 RepID=UPI001C272AFB|nr:rab3 GTPase-activating protein catalytic subunit-like isoform X2 [Salvia splendens]